MFKFIGETSYLINMFDGSIFTVVPQEKYRLEFAGSVGPTLVIKICDAVNNNRYAICYYSSLESLMRNWELVE